MHKTALAARMAMILGGVGAAGCAKEPPAPIAVSQEPSVADSLQRILDNIQALRDAFSEKIIFPSQRNGDKPRLTIEDYLRRAQKCLRDNDPEAAYAKLSLIEIIGLYPRLNTDAIEDIEMGGLFLQAEVIQPIKNAMQQIESTMQKQKTNLPPSPASPKGQSASRGKA